MRCVELGAGVGLVGLALAAMGARVTITGGWPVAWQDGVVGSAAGTLLLVRLLCPWPRLQISAQPARRRALPPPPPTPPPACPRCRADVGKVLPLMRDNLAANGYHPARG